MHNLTKDKSKAKRFPNRKTASAFMDLESWGAEDKRRIFGLEDEHGEGSYISLWFPVTDWDSLPNNEKNWDIYYLENTNA